MDTTNEDSHNSVSILTGAGFLTTREEIKTTHKEDPNLDSNEDEREAERESRHKRRHEAHSLDSTIAG